MYVYGKDEYMDVGGTVVFCANNMVCNEDEIRNIHLVREHIDSMPISICRKHFAIRSREFQLRAPNKTKIDQNK